MTQLICEECGALLEEGKTCRDYSNEMIKWNFEDFLGVGQVHHLTVLCFNLQHPSLYSKRGLEDAKDFLKEFVDKNVSFEEHDLRNRERLSSAVRDWKIAGTPEDHGEYATAPQWEMRAQDVVLGGLEGYGERVKAWSASIYNTLKQASNL